MSKRKRIIALVTSFSIVFSNVDSAMNGLSIFAEENTNTSNNQKNNDNPNNENSENNAAQWNTPSIDTNPPSGNIGDNVQDNTPPTGGTNDKKPSGTVDLNSIETINCKKHTDGIYYTKEDTIDFKIPATNISTVSLKNTDDQNFKLTSNIDSDKGIINLRFEIKNTNTKNTASIEFTDDNGDTLQQTLELKFSKYTKNNDFTLVNNTLPHVKNDDEVYYFNDKTNQFKIKLDSKDYFNNDIKDITVDSKKGNFDVNNNGDIFDISNINSQEQNEPNILTVKFTDSLGNEFKSTFKFIIDSRKLATEFALVDNTLTYVKKDEVYYFNSKTDKFEIKLNPKDNFGNDIKNITVDSKEGNFDITQTKNIFEISNITENKINKLVVKFTDSLNNSYESTFKFVKYPSQLNNELTLVDDKLIHVKKGETYYFNVKTNKFQIKLNSKDKFGNKLDITQVPTQLDGFNVSVEEKDDFNIYTISNITTENEENELVVNFKDLLNNTHTSTFKFVKDAHLPKVNMSPNEDCNDIIDSASINIEGDESKENIFYVKNNKNKENISVKFNIDKEYYGKDITPENIFINGEKLSKSKSKFNLFNILKNTPNYEFDEDNSILILNNIKQDTPYKIEFKNLFNSIGNESNLQDNTFIVYQDSTDIDLVLNKDDINMSFREKENSTHETIYVNHLKNEINLNFKDSEEDKSKLNQIKSLVITDISDKDNEIVLYNSDNNNTEDKFNYNLTFTDGKSIEQNLKVSAIDYSGNETTKTYTIIKDCTNYGKDFNLDKVLKTTFAGKKPKTTTNGIDYKNEFYIDNTDVAKSAYESKFIFDCDLKKFTVTTPDRNNISYIKDSSVTVSPGINSFTYGFIAKNGSLNKTLNYKVNYIEKNDLNIKLSYDGKTDIEGPDAEGNPKIYTNINNFNLKLEVKDENIKEIDNITVTLKYIDTNGNNEKSFNGNLKDTKNLFTIDTDNSNYTIDENKFASLLGLTKLEDGQYSILVSVDSRFDNVNSNKDGKVFKLEKTFHVDSVAPKPHFIVYDNVEEEYKLLDNITDAFINTKNAYIAINKNDLDNEIYGKFTKISILNDNKEIKSINYDEFPKASNSENNINIDGNNYIVYELDESFLSENNKFNLTVNLTDNKHNSTDNKDRSDFENSINKETINTSYTIDTIAPELKIIANSEISEEYNKELKLRDTNDNDDSDIPYINLKDIQISITDNTDLSSDIITSKNFFFKNTLNRIGNEIKLNKGKDNDSDTNELNVLGIDQEGEHVVKITTTDAAGNKTEKFVKFKTDITAPTIDIGSLTKNEALGSLENVTVDLDGKSKLLKLLSKNPTVTDGKMQATDYLELEFTDRFNESNKKSYNSNESGKSPYNSNEFKFNTSNLTEGVYDVVLTARDKAGNTTVSTSNNKESLVTIDTISPDLTVSLSEDSATTEFKGGTHDIDKHKNTSKVVPTLEIKDKSTDEITYSLSKGQTKNNLSNILTKTTRVDTSKDGYTQNLNIDSISDNAYYNLNVSTTDRLGRPTNSNITFAIDTEAPKLSLKVGNKDVTNGDKIFLNAKDNKDLIATVSDNLSTQDEIETNITINGSSKNSTSHKFTSDGEFNVTVISKDKADNKSDEFNFTVIVDTVLPTIDITGVEDGQYTNKDIDKLKIEVKDERNLHPESAEIITLNGAPYTKDTVIRAENEYELVVKATDEALNETIQTVKFVIDKTAPEFTVEGIENGKTYVEGERIIPKVKFKNPQVETDTIVSMTLNNKDYNGHEIVKDDKYVLYVTATDLASNKYEQKYEFKANLIPPEIILSKQLKTLKETGQTSDKVKLDITFKDALPEKCRILVNGTEYLPGDTLSRVGEYNLVITAEDEDKNTNEESFRFRIVEDEANPNSATKDKTMTASTFRLIAFSITAILLLIASLLYIISKKKSNKNSEDN